MKIVIDARFWGPTHTGLGVYTREMVLNLTKLDSQNDYVLLLRREAANVAGILPSNFSVKIVDARAYTFREQLLLPVVLYQIRPDLVHFPSVNAPLFYFGPFVVTIHDLIKHHSRGISTTTHHPLQYWFKYYTYLFLTSQIVSRAKKIITPSRSVAEEIKAAYPGTGSKLIVTYEAPSLMLSREAADHPEFPAKFAIYTGNAYPHKNLEKLIAIWPEINKRTGLELVLSGGRDAFSKRINHFIEKLRAQESVHYQGFLTDEQLKAAYLKASLYVFPTLIEGFGLPGLDAMALGVPVVCSDIPVLREVYGNAAHYFDPLDSDDMTEKIVEAASVKQLRSKLIANGKAQVKKYSWKKLAQETLRAYESLAPKG